MAAAWLKLLGKAVHAARRRAGMTQAQLGEPLLSKSFISQLEKGALAPSMPSLFHLADKLHVRPAQLLGMADPLLWADTLFTMAEAALLLEGADAAEEWLQPCAQLPDWRDPARLAREQRLEGLKRLAAGLWDEAVEYFQQAAALHAAGSPEARITRFWLGEAYRAAGRLIAAVREWEGLLAGLGRPIPSTPLREPVLVPSSAVTMCLRAVTSQRLAEIYETIGDRETAVEVRARFGEGLAPGEDVIAGTAAVTLLWLTAQEAYHQGDLLGACPCARLVSLLAPLRTASR